MGLISYKCKASDSAFKVKGHIDTFDSTKLIEDPEYLLFSCIVVDIMNKEFCKSSKVLVASTVRWLFFLNLIV